MITREQVANGVEKAAEGLFGVDPKTADRTAPCSSYGIDSLDIIELLLEVENEINVEFLDEKLKLEPSMTFDQFIDQLMSAAKQ